MQRRRDNSARRAEVLADRADYNERAHKLFDKYSPSYTAIANMCGKRADSVGRWRKAEIKQSKATINIMHSLLQIIYERRLDHERAAKLLADDTARLLECLHRATQHQDIFDNKRYPPREPGDDKPRKSDARELAKLRALSQRNT